MSDASSTADFLPTGEYVATHTRSFEIGDETIDLTWRLVRKANGALESLDVTQAGGVLSSNAEMFVTRYVNAWFAAVLEEKTTRFYRRHYFNYVGPNLDGEYWLSGIRFAPLYPNDPHPYLLNAERWVCFDIEADGVDHEHAWAIASERVGRLVSRLAFIANLALETPSLEQVWVLSEKASESGIKSERLQRGFFVEHDVCSEMPTKGQLAKLGNYSGALLPDFRPAGLTSLPPDTRRILAALDTSDLAFRETFDRVCRLYEVSLFLAGRFPTASLAYRVAAVEAAAQAEIPKRSFAEFVKEYVDVPEEHSKLLETLWGPVRSAHFHSGSFVLADYEFFGIMDLLLDPREVQSSQLRRLGHELTRTALISWAMIKLHLQEPIDP